MSILDQFLLFYVIPTMLTYFLAKFFWWVYPKQFYALNPRPSFGTLALIFIPFVNYFGLTGFLIMSLLGGVQYLSDHRSGKSLATRILRMKDEED